jgi:hypothetical protein
LEFPSLLDRFLPIRHFTDDLQIGAVLDRRGEELPEGWEIFRHESPDRTGKHVVSFSISSKPEPTVNLSESTCEHSTEFIGLFAQTQSFDCFTNGVFDDVAAN